MSVKRLGLPWLIALVVIPLLMAVIGYEVPARHPSGRVSSAPSTSAPRLSLAAFSLTRSGNSVTLTGDFPDESAKAALLKVLNNALGPGVDIVDEIRIDPTVDALDFAKAKPVFSDSASIADFAVTVRGDTITLAGTAASPGQKDTVVADAKRIWSNLNVVDNLAVNAPTASPSPTAAASCGNLQSAINTLTDGALTFESNLGSLTASDEQVLTRIADKLKACPNAHATINGYADSTGNASLNVPLSEERAQTVAGFLEAHGVPGDRLSTTGFGSANPIAPNGTDDGRAQNRRVEIVVS